MRNQIRTNLLVFCCILTCTLQAKAIDLDKLQTEGRGGYLPVIAQITLLEPKCAGQKGSIYIDSVIGGSEPYYYSIDGINFSTDPKIWNIPSGEHSLYVRDKVGAISDTLIFMPEPPPFDVVLRASENPVKAGVPISVEAFVNPPDTKLEETSWRPKYLIEKHNTLKQEVSLRSTTNFYVLVTNEFGCQASSYLTVEVDERGVFAPNVFDPFSDTNNFFTIYAGSGVLRVLSLEVYNRWGFPVFSQKNFLPNDPTKGWDGRIDGKRAQSDVYIYQAIVEYLDGSQELLKGDLAILPTRN